MLNEIKFSLSNCFGITSLCHSFSFTKHRAHLIYAPNGTMKTSFAKTLRHISGQSKEKPEDLIYSDRTTTFAVTVDGTAIQPETLFVFNGEDDIDSSKCFINFLASTELKQHYENIYSMLNKEKEALISKLKTVTLSTDCEKEIIDAFSNGDDDTIFSMLERIYAQCSSDRICYKFKYNDFFDVKGTVKAFVEKFKSELQTYFEVYLKLLNSSVLYRAEGDHHFGTYQVSQLLQMVADGNFFGVRHKLTLQDGTEIASNDDLEQFIKKEQDRILTDTRLKKAFEKITKAVDRNSELRGFKKILEQHPDWIPQIFDFDNFKRNVWLGFLSDKEVFPLFKQYNDVYIANKNALLEILQSAEKQQKAWIDIINLYNARFHVPIRVVINNQKDIILKQQAAKLSFKYDEGVNAIETDKQKLVKVLSRGEIRAFHILQFLFEMEERKRLNNDSVIILDDVADSFDYQNKYAIIEYIRDLLSTSGKNIYMIILTHNYDFYRTLALRLSLNRNNLWMSIRNSNGLVEIVPGQYRSDVYANAFVGHDDDNRIFISMIPFVRNLVMYTEGENSKDYLTLTSCLHRKHDTFTITERNISEIIKKYIRGKVLKRSINENRIYDLIINTANEISLESNVDGVLIQNKIVLSIAIRLLTEEYLYNTFIRDSVPNERFESSSNQLAHWSQLFKELYPNNINRITIERVNMMTPEFIHINSFMFEPLIDMSIYHLLDLYNDCKKL